jgi:predicted ribosome quality control (RQC) complex YloA/Tae2 family protein
MSKRDNEYMRFESSDGFEILVGKSAQDNDYLTFRIGGQNDFWLHVAATSGSHVIVKNPDNLVRLPKATLKEAAVLAAYYSKSRGGGRVAVSYTQCRNVSRARGAPAGQVQIKKHQSIFASGHDFDKYFK